MSTRLVPETLDGALSFYAAHLPNWSASGPSIGLSAEQTAQLGALIAAAEAARDLRVAAEQSARAAAMAHRNAMKRLTKYGAGLVATIRATAQTNDDKSVYNEAAIPAPRKGGAPQRPQAPAIRSGNIRGADGAVELKWTGSRAGGVNFQIYRRLNGAARATLVASVSGRRSYIDHTVPFGTRELTYHLVAVRGGLASLSSTAVAVQLPGTMNMSAVARAAEIGGARLRAA